MADAPLVLSASSMKVYLRCSYQYLLSSVWRVPGAPNMAMTIGTATHSGIEALHKGLDPVEATQTAFWRELASMPEPYEEPPGTALADALTMVEVYREKVLPTFEPDLVEASFVVSIGDVLFSGQIDAADEDVRDLKTTAGKTINGKPPSAFKPESHRLQLTGYSLGYQFLTGRKPRRLLLDVLTRRGTYRSFEVAPDYGEFMDVLNLTASGIMKSEFEPTGVSTGACRFCPYYAKECAYGVID